MIKKRFFNFDLNSFLLKCSLDVFFFDETYYFRRYWWQDNLFLFFYVKFFVDLKFAWVFVFFFYTWVPISLEELNRNHVFFLDLPFFRWFFLPGDFQKLNFKEEFWYLYDEVYEGSFDYTEQQQEYEFKLLVDEFESISRLNMRTPMVLGYLPFFFFNFNVWCRFMFSFYFFFIFFLFCFFKLLFSFIYSIFFFKNFVPLEFFSIVEEKIIYFLGFFFYFYVSFIFFICKLPFLLFYFFFFFINWYSFFFISMFEVVFFFLTLLFIIPYTIYKAILLNSKEKFVKFLTDDVLIEYWDFSPLFANVERYSWWKTREVINLFLNIYIWTYSKIKLLFKNQYQKFDQFCIDFSTLELLLFRLFLFFFFLDFFLWVFF